MPARQQPAVFDIYGYWKLCVKVVMRAAKDLFHCSSGGSRPLFKAEPTEGAARVLGKYIDKSNRISPDWRGSKGAGSAKSNTAILAVVAIALSLNIIPAYGDDGGRSDGDMANPLALSLTIADAMIASCFDLHPTANGTPIAIAVVDAAGALLSFRRTENASPLIGDIALMKARTAVQARVATGTLGDYATQDASTRDALLALRLTDIPGGMPFAPVATIVVGAVGVSGGSAEQDKACARRAINAGSAAVLNLRKH